MPEEKKEQETTVTTSPTTTTSTNVTPYVPSMSIMPMMQFIPMMTWVPLYPGMNMGQYDQSSQIRQIVLQVLVELGMVKDSSITKK